MRRFMPDSNATTETVAQALLRAASLLADAGIENPRYDANELLMFVLSIRREELILNPDRVLPRREQLAFDNALSSRGERKPLAYIIGERWFYGRPFTVNDSTLIPRPETELLVDFVKEKASTGLALRAADIGTGSGCIAVSLALEIPDSLVFAVDLSPRALLVAEQNVQRHFVESRVTLVEGDLLSPLLGNRFDTIVSNPPYIRPDEIPFLMPEVGRFEPAMALWKGSGDNGAAIHERLIIGARSLIRAGGWLAMEVGAGQADLVCSIAEQYGYKSIHTRRDLGGIDRVVAAQMI